MQKNIHIFMRLPDGRRTVVARLLYEKLADSDFRSYFRYEPAWLNESTAFSLDPVNLPLGTDVFQLKSRTGLWGVLEDALPDAWGRRLLQARQHIDVSRSNNIDLLLLTGWAEPGATGFAGTRQMPASSVVPVDMEMMNQAISASENFEKSGDPVNLPDFIISGGSSAGGARPKILARSASGQYLVKFPSINDPAPEVMSRLEFFGLSCVRYAGIPVPDFFIVKSEAGRLALAIRRFDTTDQNGRLHFLSLQSLIGVEEQLGLPYAGMADIVRKVSVEPKRDIENLYKQMVVNIIIHNCDDHLKNFSMIYCPSEQGFCLSPAYDVVPNLWQRKHILSIAGKTGDIGYDDLLRAGKQFAVSGQRTQQLIREAAEGVSKALAENISTFSNLSSSYPLCKILLADVRKKLAEITTAQQTGRL